MIYKYIFQCPIKYEIYENNKYIEEVSYNDIRKYISYTIINKLIQQYTVNFIKYLNHDGVINIQFSVIFGKILKINISMNHPLTKNEFNSLYEDLQIQLMDELGKYINKQCLLEYIDTNENINQDKKELNQIKKQIYCSVWQDHDWKLVYITNQYYKQKTHTW